MGEELQKLRLSHAELQTQAQADHEVLKQVEHIATGKPYLLQCTFGNKGFVELTQLWQSAEVFKISRRARLTPTFTSANREAMKPEAAF